MMDLTDNLAAWRFVGWTGLVLLAEAVISYVRHHELRSAFRLFNVSVAGLLFVFGLQQFFWWRNEVLRARGNCDAHDASYDVVACTTQSEWAAWAAIVTPPAFVMIGVFAAAAWMPLGRMRYGLTWGQAATVAFLWLMVTYVVGLFWPQV